MDSKSGRRMIKRFRRKGWAPLRIYYEGPSLFRMALGLLVMGFSIYGFSQGRDHEVPDHSKGTPKSGQESRPGAKENLPMGDGACTVNPYHLAEFANSEEYDFSNMVGYLSTPACYSNARQVSQIALSSGVSFSSKPPFKLKEFAASIPKNDLEAARRVDQTLARTVPRLLRNQPQTQSELLPLIGQLSLLSPIAARSALGTLIVQEAIQGGRSLRATRDLSSSEMVAAEIAKNLVKMGAGENMIADELAASVEEMAISSQADSLENFFVGLGAAAKLEPSLGPTFNLTSGALNRGIQKMAEELERENRSALIRVAFEAVRASLSKDGSLEPAAGELNEALGVLISGAPLSRTALRKLWKECLNVLAQSGTQAALAEAVALSLTPEAVLLPAQDRVSLTLAARNYPALALALQSSFMVALSRLHRQMERKTLTRDGYENVRVKYLDPLLNEILDFDPYLIDPRWLNQLLEHNLVTDENIEKKFPRFVLAYLDRWATATKPLASEIQLDAFLFATAESFAVLSTLSQVHIPALVEWVKRHE